MPEKKSIIKEASLFSSMFLNIKELIFPSPLSKTLSNMDSVAELFAGQRLEPDSRSSDCSRGIQAPIPDPAFILSKQLAMGEFEGEDAASVAYVKYSFNNDKLKKILIKDREIDYKESTPLEVYIESTPLEVATLDKDGEKISKLDLQIRMKIGLQFTRELEEKFPEIPELVETLAGTDGYPFTLNEYQKKFELEQTDSFLSLLEGRIIDISQVFGLNETMLENELAAKIELASTDRREELLGKVKDIILDLKHSWIDSTNEDSFFQIPKISSSAWDPKKLEYDFKVQFGDDQKKLICAVDGYREDHLNWSCFTVEKVTGGYKLPTDPLGERVVLPKHLRFGGQPEKRFYDFEDSHVNFGALHPKITDIMSTLLMQFAFVYSADWYNFPLIMELGTIGQIKNLVVIDTFGDEKPLDHAGYIKDEKDILNNEPEWDLWNAFTLSKKQQNGGNRNTKCIFLPPVITDLTISPPHEEIKFLRDETANLAWAVEKVYRTLYGDPVYGYDHYRYQRNMIEHPEEISQMGNSNLANYTFMTPIPWNWIPFIPVRGAGIANTDYPDYKQIAFQRGALIDQLTGKPISPNSRLLNEESTPYFIDEAIIPRTGILYSERYQRTVWQNGKTFLWIGRKKTIGTGEGYSGLKFDIISIPQK